MDMEEIMSTMGYDACRWESIDQTISVVNYPQKKQRGKTHDACA